MHQGLCKEYESAEDLRRVLSGELGLFLQREKKPKPAGYVHSYAVAEEDSIIDRAITETYAIKDITAGSDFTNIEPPLLSDFEMVSKQRFG